MFHSGKHCGGVESGVRMRRESCWVVCVFVFVIAGCSSDESDDDLNVGVPQAGSSSAGTNITGAGDDTGDGEVTTGDVATASRDGSDDGSTSDTATETETSPPQVCSVIGGLAAGDHVLVLLSVSDDKPP